MNSKGCTGRLGGRKGKRNIMQLYYKLKKIVSKKKTILFYALLNR